MGLIQQIQSFSTLDGPGTRCVIFLQGCPVGCIFCHNPDSWEAQGGTEFTVQELIRRIDRFRPFLPTPGLTISGGEPLFQPEFTMDLIKEAHLEGWHVAVDTSGWGTPEWFEQITSEADLVILSIKHPLDSRSVSRCDSAEVRVKLEALAKVNTPVWLRYVLIPGWTDQPEVFPALAQIAADLPNLKKMEILPYNGLAKTKWEKLKWDSPIFYDLIETVTEEQVRIAEKKVTEYLKNMGIEKLNW